VDSCITRLENIKFLKKNKKYINLTKTFLTDPSFLCLAYLQIKSKPGNTTRAVDIEILNSIKSEWFFSAAHRIKNNQYFFKPARRINIQKSNSSELRLFIIESPRDKIIQKAILILFHQIYEIVEKTFSDSSHGCRSGRSPHSALKDIKRYWTGLYWFVETDINKAFDTYNRNILMNILEKTIADQRISDLIRRMFNAHILAPKNFFFVTNLGVPQGNVLLPMLNNIYFNELDNFMEELTKKYHKGSFPTSNEEYKKLLNLSKYERILSSIMQKNILRCRRKKLFNKGIKLYLYDGNYIRVKYIRYVDDILIGIRGPKEIAEQIKKEFQNWLKSNLHLDLKEKKTRITYAVGNKIKFLGFVLFRYSYSQWPYRNSRKIEKQKRVRNRILSYQVNAKQKIEKIVRTKLTKTMFKKLGTTHKKEESTHFIKTLSETLIQIVDNEFIKTKNFREILRELETNIAKVILNDTNKKIKTLLASLITPALMNPLKGTAPNKNSFNKNVTFFSKSHMFEAHFASKFTDLLKNNGFEWAKKKNVRFENNIVKYLRQNSIKLTFYPSNFTLNETPVNDRVTLEQSTQSVARINVLEQNEGTLTPLPIQIRTDWTSINLKLQQRGFLNKKFLPAAVTRVLSLGVADIIKHFNQVLLGYIFFYRCVDDFVKARARFFWYFKMSLVSTLKTKLKLGGRGKVFDKYPDLKCLDSKGNIVQFIKWEVIKSIKSDFSVNQVIENPEKLLNRTCE
jgi:retron-type reverse transcriptase